MRQAARTRLQVNGLENDRSYMRWIWLMNWLARNIIARKEAHRAVCGAKAVLPRNTWLFDGIGPNCRAIKEGATSWRALYHIYNHPFEPVWKYALTLRWHKALQTFVDNWWIGMMNAQAVRNRYKIIRDRIIDEAAEMYLYNGRPVRILSVACGSAQSVIEAVSELKKIGVESRVLLIDNDPNAVSYAMREASRYGVGNWFEARVEDVVRRSGKIARDFGPDIGEVAGLIDYLAASLATRVIAGVTESLQPGGMVITCNIMDNPERPFLTEGINWDGMIYRTESELEQIVRDAGHDDVEVAVEPHRIHAIAFARKSAEVIPIFPPSNTAKAMA